MTFATPPTDLRTAYAADPIGIDERTPTLRWRVPTDRRGASQTAFRVLVASTADRLVDDEGDVWDTGKRVSDRPAVRYDGAELSATEDYHWKVAVWDDRDVASEWSEPATWETGPLDPGDWSAAWIRRRDAGRSRGQFSHFRREFHLDGPVERARAYVSASHRYALSVNGESVDRGPAPCYPDHQYYRTVAVGEELSEGANAVGALHAWNGAGQGRPAAEPGFLFQLVVEFADGRERAITTDGTWSTREGAWLDAGLRNDETAEPVEVTDGRDVPLGWDLPGFDDGDWGDAAVVGEHPVDPWERLIAQDRDVVRERIGPESVRRIDGDAAGDGGTGDTYVVDFGKVYAGVPVVEFSDGTAGHRVNLRAGYRLTGDGRVDDTEGTQSTDMRYGYVQRGGEQRFRPFHYLGFRYLQIDDPGERLDASDVGLLASHNDVPDPDAAPFACDDETVEAVVDLARHSALYGSQEQFVDTPTREKGQFLFDAFDVSTVTTRAFGERRLSRGSIREFCRSHYRYWAPEGRLNGVYPNGDGARDIPDFSVAFPEWLARYYRESDDRRTLEDAYPVVRAVADYVVEHVDDETGLVTRLSGGEGGPYHEGIVDWPPEMRYGYDRDWPARTTVNVLCANALDRAAEIAAELGRPAAERDYYERHRDRVERAVNDHLLDGDRYVDGCDADVDEDSGDVVDASEQASQHANALPLATGLAPEEVRGRVADRVAADGMRMGPMMVRYLLGALDAADRPAATVELLTDPDDDGWANVLERGGTFTWESWHCRSLESVEERRNRSESHAMGATVLTAVQRTLLGVRVESPGGADLRIDPPAAGLDAASGRVPTERGPVAVDWERDRTGFSLDVTVPWNATATAVLHVSDSADARTATVTEGGETILDGDGTAETTHDGHGTAATLPNGIESVEATDGSVVVSVGAGSYDFDLRERRG